VVYKYVVKLPDIFDFQGQVFIFVTKVGLLLVFCVV